MSKTREELIRYADGMSFESAWRAYAGMVESGELTMEDLQVVIKPELYREVERYFAGKRLEERMIRLPGGEHRIINDDELSVVRQVGRPVSGDELTQADDLPIKRYEIETSVLEWLESNSFEVIDDSRVTVFRRGNVDALLDDGTWRVICYAANRARLIKYEMEFTPATPASIVVYSIMHSL